MPERALIPSAHRLEPPHPPLELAHLAHPDHSAAFWRLVHRYAKAERAIGYLIAKSGDGDEVD